MSTTAYQARKRLDRVSATAAALNNEQVTRGRVLNLEKQAHEADIRLNHYGDLLKPLSRGFWGRLKWLVTGK